MVAKHMGNYTQSKSDGIQSQADFFILEIYLGGWPNMSVDMTPHLYK